MAEKREEAKEEPCKPLIDPHLLDPLLNFFSELGSLTRATRREDDAYYEPARRPVSDQQVKAVSKQNVEYSRADAGILLTYEILNGKGTGEFVVEDILDKSAAAMTKLIDIGDRVIEIDEVRLVGKSLTEANDLLSGRHNTVVGIKLFSFSKKKEYTVRMVLKSHRSKLDWSMQKLQPTQDFSIASPQSPYMPSISNNDLSSADDEERERALKIAKQFARQQASLQSSLPKFSAHNTSTNSSSKIPVSFRFV